MNKTNQATPEATPYITEAEEKIKIKAFLNEQYVYDDDINHDKTRTIGVLSAIAKERALKSLLQTAHEEGLEQGQSEVLKTAYSLADKSGSLNYGKLFRLLSNKQTTTKKNKLVIS